MDINGQPYQNSWFGGTLTKAAVNVWLKNHLPVLPQVFQADLHVQFSAASNDMLTALFGAADHQLVGFREPLQAFHKFGEVLTILQKPYRIMLNWSWAEMLLTLSWYGYPMTKLTDSCNYRLLMVIFMIIISKHRWFIAYY